MGFFERVGLAILSGMLRISEWFATKINALLESVIVRKMGPIPSSSARAEQAIREPIIRMFDHEVAPLFRSSSPITPSQGFKLAGQLWGTALSADAICGTVGMMAELAGMGQLETPRGAVRDALRFLGIHWIQDAYLGEMFRTAIQAPLSYYYRNRYRPLLPSWDEFKEAFGRDKIDLRTFQAGMAFYGRPDEWLRMYEELAARPVSAFLIRYLAESDVGTLPLFKELTIDAGYGVKKGELVALGMFQSVLRGYRYGAVTSATRLYKEGFKTRAWLLNEVRRIWRMADRDELIALRADYDYEYDLAMDTLRVLRDAFFKDLITEEDFLIRTDEQGWVRERMEEILAREIIRKMPRPKRS